MKKAFDKKTKDHSRSKSGFALIMTISILGFLVVIVLSLANMLRVGSAINETEAKQSEIREYAWAAAMQGLIRLQAELGSDLSYSALSEGFGSKPPAADIRKVTGVTLPTWFDALNYVVGAWRRSSAGATPSFRSWLYRTGNINIWKEIVPGIEVRLYRGNPTEGPDPSVAGNVLFTYWIEDEGLKASVKAFNEFYTDLTDQNLVGIGADGWQRHLYRYALTGNTNGVITSDDLDLNIIKRYQLQLAATQDLSAIFTDNNVLTDTAGNATAYTYKRDRLDIFERSQSYFFDAEYANDGSKISIAGTSYNLADAAERKEAEIILFRSLGINHVGLLTNPVSGGFKKDLSLLPEDYASGLADWMYYPAYMVTVDDWNGGTGSYDDVSIEHRRRYEISAPSTTTNDRPYRVVAPILTDLHLKYAIGREGDQVLVFERIYFKLWNPYTSALEFKDLELEISGLPEVKIMKADKTETARIELGDGGSGDTRTLTISFDQGGNWEVVGENLGYWVPGRVYTFAVDPNDEDNVKIAVPADIEAYTREYNTGVSMPAGSYTSPPTPPDTDAFPAHYLEIPDSILEISLKIQGGATLWTIDGVAFKESNQDKTFGFETEGEPIPNTQFGFRVRLYEPGDIELSNDAVEKGEWLEFWDPRNPNLTYHVGPDVSEGLYWGREGDLISEIVSTDVHEKKLLLSREMGDRYALVDTPLFELPRQGIISMASLQHVPIVGKRPFMIGNPWGEDHNDLFDEYYLSGLVPGILEPDLTQGQALPNPRLRLIESVSSMNNVVGTGVGTANGLPDGSVVVDGAFNINSLDVEAWHAVLSKGLVEDWTFVDIDADGIQSTGTTTGEVYNGIERTSLRNAFLRFSQSAHETFYLGDKPQSDIPPREFFRRGVRELTDDQVHELAEAIVEGIRDFQSTQNRPFSSLREFIEEGIIAEAIEEAGLNVLADAEVDYGSDRDNLGGANFKDHGYDGADIWNYSPFFLTQADVLSAIDPFLTVRSDTFTIRGYAEQRFVTGAAAPTASSGLIASAMVELLVQRTYNEHPSYNANSNVRQFKIIGVRWIEN